MKGFLTLLLVCAGLPLLAGCGGGGSGSANLSSSSSTRTSTSTSTSTAKTRTTSAHAGRAAVHALSGTVNVAYRQIAISPDSITVKVGTTIKWTNYDGVDHNVTTQGAGPAQFASRNFGRGGTYEFKATTPGVISYLCTIHPTSMVGTITVVR